MAVQLEGNSAPIKIPMRGVVKIKETIIAVNKPVGNVYRVFEDSASQTVLYLNGKEELNIAPSVKDEVYRIFITGKGKSLLLNFLMLL